MSGSVTPGSTLRLIASCGNFAAGFSVTMRAAGVRFGSMSPSRAASAVRSDDRLARARSSRSACYRPRQCCCGLWFPLGRYLRRDTHELGIGSHVLVLMRRNWHVEPFLKHRINALSKEAADVRALAGTRKRAESVDGGQVVAVLVQIEDLLIPSPRRFLFDRFRPSDFKGEEERAVARSTRKSAMEKIGP